MRVDLFGSTFDLDETFLACDAPTVERRLREYEAGDRQAFGIDVRIPEGFGFTGRVMEAMRAVPCGETRTYGELARDLDTAAVAVGGACGRNPVPLIVPCHRIVASDGGLGGYSAPGGLAVKRRLLDHEAELAGKRGAQTTLDGGVVRG
jgi:methylated-DNA-[protein]-cysteine S-methyltransferase